MVRDFLGQFAGLTGSMKQKKVLDATGLSRVGLSALRSGDALDHDRTGELLAAMKKHTRLVQPKALGIIGEEHLKERMREMGCEMESFKYHKKPGMTGGLPWVVEAAFAWNQETQGRRLITGVNWSPAIGNPFRRLGRSGHSLDSVLSGQFAGHEEPVVLVLHLTCPRVDYTDRGKSAVIISNEED
jgi:DNA topoisomerase VI subunit B